MVVRKYQQPFPDLRDPTTGEWLPSSYSSEKAFAEARRQESVTKSQARSMTSMLLSIFK